jgi:nitrite reductase (cytochrome c-552)
MGFHAPGEALRVLADAVDSVRKGQLALRGVTSKPAKVPAPVESPVAVQRTDLH